MNDSFPRGNSRREFPFRTPALGAASLLALPRTAAAEPLPEVKKIRLLHAPAICLAPQYVDQELLHEVGMIKSKAQKIIAQGTDWRFFNEAKRELKT